MSAAAIRAGRAFVEMFMHDETVQKSMEDLKTKFRAFGATVGAVGTESFSTLNTASATALAATAGSAATASAGTALIGSAVYAVTNAFRVLFTTITGGVTMAAGSLRGISYIVRDIFPKGGAVQRSFDAFLNESGTMEKAGRWGRLVGSITGNNVVRGMGIRMERLGMAAAIEKGFRDGGFAGYLKAYLGAGFRSAKSIVAGQVASTITFPFRAAFSLVSGGAATAAASLSQISSATGGVAASIAKATTPIASMAGASVHLASVIPRVLMAAAKMGGLAALLSGPALLAAKGFATASAEITAKSKETGESIESLITKKYGTFSFITPKDIAAGNALSESLKQLKQTTSSAFAQLGIAALPVLKKTTDFLIGVTQAVTRFVAENRQVISTGIAIAAKVVAIAGGIAAAAAAFPMVMTAVGALLHPVGLVALALGGLVYYFPQIRQAAADAFNWLMPNFAELGTVFSGTIGGIIDAMQGGSIDAAARVMWAGLNLAWLAGTEQLRAIYRGLVADVQMIGEEAFTTLEMAWTLAIASMQDAWQAANVVFAAAMEPVYAKMEAAQKIWNWIAEQGTYAFRKIGEVAQWHLSAIQTTIETLKPIWEGICAFLSEAWKVLVGQMKTVFGGLTSFMRGGLTEAVATGLGKAYVNALPGSSVVTAALKSQQAMASEGFKKEQAEHHKAAGERLKSIEAEHQERLKGLAAEATKRETDAKTALEAARKEFQESTAAAKTLKDNALAERAGKGVDAAKANAGLVSGFGSFSASAANRIGVSGVEKLEEHAKSTADNTAETAALLRDMKGGLAWS